MRRIVTISRQFSRIWEEILTEKLAFFDQGYRNKLELAVGRCADGTIGVGFQIAHDKSKRRKKGKKGGGETCEATAVVALDPSQRPSAVSPKVRNVD